MTASHPISAVIAHPLSQRLPQPTRTSWGTYDRVSILVVEVRTESGLTGYGEGLARFAPGAHADLVETCFRPRLIGRDALDIEAHWQAMRRSLSGRAGGVLVEAISAVDIALWDIAGKAAGLSVARLLAGSGRTEVPAYAASVGWGGDAAAEVQVAEFLERGFTSIKIKIGAPVEAAIARIALVRRLAGDAVELTADANWAYSLDEAERVARALAQHGYAWFEEPLRPEDEQGYELLRARSPVPLAAGESNFTLEQAQRLVQNRTLSVLQPNVTRAGGITGTLRMARLAAQHDVAYAPHVGMSGIICEAASLQIAAAMPNTRILECPILGNRFRSDLADLRPASERARGGMVPVPQGPGLGIAVKPEALADLSDRYREAA